jgi:hypothetical protein
MKLYLVLFLSLALYGGAPELSPAIPGLTSYEIALIDKTNAKLFRSVAHSPALLVDAKLAAYMDYATKRALIVCNVTPKGEKLFYGVVHVHWHWGTRKAESYIYACNWLEEVIWGNPNQDQGTRVRYLQALEAAKTTVLSIADSFPSYPDPGAQFENP